MLMSLLMTARGGQRARGQGDRKHKQGLFRSRASGKIDLVNAKADHEGNDDTEAMRQALTDLRLCTRKCSSGKRQFVIHLGRVGGRYVTFTFMKEAREERDTRWRCEKKERVFFLPRSNCTSSARL